MKIRPLYLATALLLTGCGDSSDNAPQAAAPAAKPVTVVKSQAFEHSPTHHFVGRMQAIESAKLTPRTTGYLLSKRFEDGAMVEKGDVLFEIDPTSYEAALDAARATLEEATAALALTELNHKRNQNMLKTGGVSQAQLDVSAAELSMARSRVQSAKANLVVQQDNLEQTKVRAPYSGQLGKTNFSIGDMVGPNFGPLTDIVQIHPIEASFSIKESDLARHKLQDDDRDLVSLHLEGQEEFDLGEISFVDNKINPSTGAIEVAAEFANEEMAYRPNQYVRVGLRPSEPMAGVTVPHKAVHQDALSQYVFIVDNGTATKVEVEVTDRLEQDVFITAGLQPQDAVITGGLQRIREGDSVVIAE
ncbi:efflux RND transporter periplasmic adaptor subunit [Vibrio sp. WXL103]|uniref:efflux RND transporter periplasmic adaptor subunit n=1 Tax=Vibrio sp. WXL103 TaxID=3450710 RepID=UPI003EC5FFAD